MAEREYRFEIADFHPWTFSLKRLQAYIDPLLELFGHENSIYLTRVDEGSAIPCILADPNVIAALERRFLATRTGVGHKKVYRAIEDINDLLAEDRTSAVLVSPYQGRVIEFPGVKRSIDPLIGPITQHGDLQGEIIQIGGRDETISVHVRDGRETHICTATRDEGRGIAQYIFRQVRLTGTGKWIREPHGRWKLIHFKIEEPVVVLETQGVKAAFGLLRAALPKNVDVDVYYPDMRDDNKD